MLTTNSNGGATATPQLISGRGIANRHYDKRQLAALVALILDGIVGFKPSASQLAGLFRVNRGYIRLMRQMSPARRAAILAGRDDTSFTALLNSLAARPASRARRPILTEIDDAELAEMVRLAGIDRTLAIAVQVENGHAA